jgi:hypothetical protein
MVLKSWLGGLDSNQDSQLQRLMYYRLYDLPNERPKKWAMRSQEFFLAPRPSVLTLDRKLSSVNRPSITFH